MSVLCSRMGKFKQKDGRVKRQSGVSVESVGTWTPMPLTKQSIIFNYVTMTLPTHPSSLPLACMHVAITPSGLNLLSATGGFFTKAILVIFWDPLNNLAAFLSELHH